MTRQTDTCSAINQNAVSSVSVEILSLVKENTGPVYYGLYDMEISK